MIVNLIIILALGVGAYLGMKRGATILGLELISFCLSTALAFVAYSLFGSWLSSLAALPLPLSDVAAFVFTWIVVEILLGILAGKYILPHIAHNHSFSISEEIGGAILNLLKYALAIALIIMMVQGLPTPVGLKNAVTGAAIPKLMLGSTSSFESWASAGLGNDLTQSFNFLTVTTDPESTERIQLGYTTKGTSDPAGETMMLALLNHERTSRGIKPLVMNEKSRLLARSYSAEMFADGYFSHVDPAGQTPFDRMKAAGITYTAAGENLALAPTLDVAEQGLMKSPGHRANILNQAFHNVGIGITDGGTYGLMITEDFTN